MSNPELPLGHGFPAYRFGVELGGDREPVLYRARDDEHGDYVHETHVQVLIERVIQAREYLAQGRAARAKDVLDEGFQYLKRTTHCR